MKQLGLLALILAGSASIASACDRPSDAPKPTAAAASEPQDPLGPPSQAQLPTTSGAIAVPNLLGKIKTLTRDLESRPGDIESKQQLIELLATRGKYLGRIADTERAAALADELVRDAPTRAWAYVARASTRTAMHRFTEALADLAEAEKRGELPVNLIAQKATILEGQGDLDGALALRRRAREINPDLSALSLEGALLGQMGKTEEAAGLFRRAAAEHRGVSPFPVAWLFLLQVGPSFPTRAGVLLAVLEQEWHRCAACATARRGARGLTSGLRGRGGRSRRATGLGETPASSLPLGERAPAAELGKVRRGGPAQRTCGRADGDWGGDAKVRAVAEIGADRHEKQRDEQERREPSIRRGDNGAAGVVA